MAEINATPSVQKVTYEAWIIFKLVYLTKAVIHNSIHQFDHLPRYHIRGGNKIVTSFTDSKTNAFSLKNDLKFFQQSNDLIVH